MNNQVNANSQFGNFKWFATADVSDEQKDILANLGFLWIMQRSPSSNAEKTLAGYEKRPDGFKRSQIEFSDDNAKTLSKLLGMDVEIDKDVSIKPNITKVEFYEIGAKAEPAYADEKKAVLRHIDANDIASWAIDKIKFTGEGDLDTDNIALLKAVKEFKLQLLKSEM
jgi:hypothetical protein